MAALTAKAFDYSALDKDVKGKLIWYSDEIRKQGSVHVKAGMEIGRMLSEARELIGRGGFVEWVERECGYSIKSAYRYMSVWEHFGDFVNLTKIELSAMYELVSNERAKSQALKLANKGVNVTHSVAKELIQKASEPRREPPPKADPPETDSGEDASTEAPATEPAHESTAGPPRNGTDKPADFGKCPNCGGKNWYEDEFGATCTKCGQPHGEPVGDVDEDRFATQRSKTIKTLEAAMRAFDDLQAMRSHKLHGEAIKLCKDALLIARGWK